MAKRYEVEIDTNKFYPVSYYLDTIVNSTNSTYFTVFKTKSIVF